MTATAYINRIAVAVPPHDVHRAFLHFAESLLRGEPNREKIAWTVLRDKVREMV